MKTFIKLLLFGLSAFLSVPSIAQIYGIKAGGCLSLMNIEQGEFAIPYNTAGINYSMNPGFNIGGTIEFKILSTASIETGLNFSLRGFKFSADEINYGGTKLLMKGNVGLYYIDIPMNLVIPFSVKNLSLFGSVGPYAGYGINGQRTSSSTFGDLSEKTKVPVIWGDEPGDAEFRRFDYGVAAGLGVNIHPLQISVSYSLGLANISSESDYGSIINHQTYGIALAYKFGKATKSAEGTTLQKTPKEKATPRFSKKDVKMAEEEKARLEKIRTDSLVLVRAAEESARKEKIRNDSIVAERARKEQIEAERLRQEKIKSDSIARAAKPVSVKQVENAVIYRIQFASNTKSTGTRKIKIGDREYDTWEYMYSGSYRSTVGEFRTFAEAARFQTTVRSAGYPQAFVVAFRNNVRVTDAALFK